jgi:hypothetical protein
VKIQAFPAFNKNEIIPTIRDTRETAEMQSESQLFTVKSESDVTEFESILVKRSD